ncbi:hypothetical protein HMPREF0476_0162 [Kingella kingae ATCC 23330]|uniref:Uncharacterized protein n=2 Tax=Kingella kingae TaxID=504 RepID=F5S4M9_KINKI|nr:hypothetical protein HMPREF0476_0162 [Kingella kingae ATCC 23330]SQH24615.1 Uncharacterized protein conserved in bacteria [Kingella kingae]
MAAKSLNYILGLDLGIASCGWAVVEMDEQENPLRLIDVGVRTFEEAETPKTVHRWRKRADWLALNAV